MAINSYVFLPRIARSRNIELKQNVTLALGGMSALLALIVIIGFSFPGLLPCFWGRSTRTWVISRAGIS